MMCRDIHVAIHDFNRSGYNRRALSAALRDFLRGLRGAVILMVLLSYLPGCKQDVSRPAARSPADSQPAETAKAKAFGETSMTPSASVVASGQSAPTPVVALREVDRQQVTEALRAANPGFGGEVLMENQDGLIALAINDPAVRNIQPLAGLRIHRLDLYQCSVSDLGPLKGLPLLALALDRTGVTDLRPLAGMSLEYLSLSETNVSDLSPLAGMPLKQLNLVRTRVQDLTPLARCPLETLWLNETPVKDLSPLRNVPLVSLTIAGTAVEDLTPLKGMPLKRLHIARSQVTDLTPLRWLRLERLIFTPSRIKTGLDVVRNMPTLREIGTAFGESDWGIPDRVLPAQEFWALLDAGKLEE